MNSKSNPNPREIRRAEPVKPGDLIPWRWGRDRANLLSEVVTVRTLAPNQQQLQLKHPAANRAEFVNVMITQAEPEILAVVDFDLAEKTALQICDELNPYIPANHQMRALATAYLALTDQVRRIA